jgi:hypothetical protein
MLKSRTDLLDWVKSKNITWWKLYEKSGKDLIDDQSADTEVAYHALADTLEKLEPGFYILEAKLDDKPASKAFRITFKNVLSHEVAGIGNANSTQSMTIEEVLRQAEKIADEKLNKFKAEFELEQLKKENAELKKENRKLNQNGSLERVAGIVLKHIQPQEEENKTMKKEPNQNQVGQVLNNAEQELSDNIQTLLQNIQNANYDASEVIKKLSSLPQDKLEMVLPLLDKI